jgi:nucleoside-diphosphate-sugar epimerase
MSPASPAGRRRRPACSAWPGSTGGSKASPAISRPRPGRADGRRHRTRDRLPPRRQAGRSRDLKRPLDSFDTNATGTLNLLHAARRHARASRRRHRHHRERSSARRRHPCRASGAAAGTATARPSRWRPASPVPRSSPRRFRQCYLQPADGIGLATLRLPELVGGGDRRRATGPGTLARAWPAGTCRPCRRPAATHPLHARARRRSTAASALAPALEREPAPSPGPGASGPRRPARRAAIADHVAARLGASWTPAQALPGAARRTAIPRPDHAACSGALAAALGWRPGLDARRPPSTGPSRATGGSSEAMAASRRPDATATQHWPNAQVQNPTDARRRPGRTAAQPCRRQRESF